MRKIFNYLLLAMITFIGIVNVIHADETTSKSCPGSELRDIRKEAYNISAAYDYNYDEQGNVVSFTISIYNITDKLLLSIEPSVDGRMSFTTAFSGNSEDGVYKFVDTNLTELKKYTITIYAYTDSCNKKLRTISVTKPMRNKFYDYPECRYVDMQDYQYCQEWITRAFNVKDYQISNALASKKLDNNRRATNSSASDEDEEDRTTIILQMIKRGIIIGLLIGIVIDLVVIVLLIRKVRESII